MKKINDQIIICLTGLTGSGKTTVRNIFSSYVGIKTFYTKDLHEHILGNRCHNINKMDVSKLFSEKNGFIKAIMRFVEKNQENASIVVLDSIRSTDELSYIQTLGYSSTVLIRVACSSVKRIERLKKRDNCTDSDIFKRDLRDLGKDDAKLFNMHELFKLADNTIDTSRDLKDIDRQIFSILVKLGIEAKKYKCFQFNSNANSK